MSELIKREDAIKITWIEPQYSDPINVLTEVRDRIKALPTVDAVPVVRCHECKRRGTHQCKLFHTELNEWTIEFESTDLTQPDWFCADGERRSE